MGRPTKALIVDDEAHARVYVRLLLTELGIPVCAEAADGAAGLALFAQHEPDLVMLDVNLPALTGLQVLQSIRDTHPDTRVIMMSSESALRTVQEAARLGAAGYILKHSSKADALQMLGDALELDEVEGDESDENAGDDDAAR